jgi:hypothetical protein
MSDDDKKKSEGGSDYGPYDNTDDSGGGDCGGD